MSGPKRFADALARARYISANLAAETDALNNALGRAEQAISQLRLGVRAAVPLYEDGPFHAQLGFAKLDKQWRLTLETGIPGDDTDEWSVTPLVNASKEVRLMAVDELPGLVDALISVAETQANEVSQAAQKVETFVSDLATAQRGIESGEEALKTDVQFGSDVVITLPQDAKLPNKRGNK